MQAERFRQVRNLFDAALERAAESREEFLRAACVGDRELLMEVGRLLAAHGEPTGWLDAGLAPEAPAPRLEGRRFGPYEVLRQLGEGGMGSVYLAARADGAYRKHVALKLVRATAASPQVLQRFQREREILALLDHPNIARIIDGGTTDDGSPYLVMDYVEGEPIDTYCDRNRLNVAARLKLFRDVCAAVQYAHERQVIHRDLKPSNILVTADGVVKLLDFGIAKLGETASLEATALTRTDMCLMTPEYASPEQVSGGPVSPATDVYALGVVLYELLTGKKPYRMRSRIIHEVVRVIREEAPTRPSTVLTRLDGEEAQRESEAISRARAASIAELERQLRGDLDSILLKALRKDSVDRYATAGSLSHDLRQHLEGGEVVAREGEFLRSAGEVGRKSVWVGLGIAAVGLAVYNGMFRAEPAVSISLLGLFLLTLYFGARRIFGSEFVHSQLPGIATAVTAGFLGIATAFTALLKLGYSRTSALFLVYFVVMSAVNAYAYWRGWRWLRRGGSLGPLRQDLGAPGTPQRLRFTAEGLARALGAGLWYLLPLTLIIVAFGLLSIRLGRPWAGSILIAFAAVLVLYTLHAVGISSRERSLTSASRLGIVMVVLYLLWVTAVLNEKWARPSLSWVAIASFYLLGTWALPLLLITGRKEIRERGLAWSGRLIAWSDMLSYAWAADAGAVEVLKLRVRRGRSSKEVSLAMVTAVRPAVEAILHEKLSEWPAAVRPRAAAATSS